ncbi:MAG: DUF421 domain-containing protein [Armatimonadota bacterium]
MDQVGEWLEALLGLSRDVEQVNAAQMTLRAVVVYAFTLAIVRLGSKRFLGKGTAFDIILGIMIGSIMSRAINGSAPFVPTLVAGTALIGMHWGLAALSYYMDWFGPLVKGHPVLLIENGTIRREGLREASLSEKDLQEAMRLQAKRTDAEGIRLAYLERDGSISVIPEDPEPRILEVTVRDGVQTVRIQLDR